MEFRGQGRRYLAVLWALAAGLRPARAAPVLDRGQSYIYWTEQLSGQIRRARADDLSQAETVLTGLGAPTGLVVDEPSCSLLFASGSSILRAHLDGYSLETVHTIDESTSSVGITDLAFDADSKVVYWTQRNSKVKSTSLDPDSDRYHVENWTMTLTGKDSIYYDLKSIALDLSSSKVYYADEERSWIRRQTIGASSEETEETWLAWYETGYRSENLYSPTSLALDVANGYLYWADADFKVVARRPLHWTDASEEEVLATDISSPTGLVVNGSDVFFADGHRTLWKVSMSEASDGSISTSVAQTAAVEGLPYSLALMDASVTREMNCFTTTTTTSQTTTETSTSTTISTTTTSTTTRSVTQTTTTSTSTSTFTSSTTSETTTTSWTSTSTSSTSTTTTSSTLTTTTTATSSTTTRTATTTLTWTTTTATSSTRTTTVTTATTSTSTTTTTLPADLVEISGSVLFTASDVDYTDVKVALTNALTQTLWVDTDSLSLTIAHTRRLRGAAGEAKDRQLQATMWVGEYTLNTRDAAVAALAVSTAKSIVLDNSDFSDSLKKFLIARGLLKSSYSLASFTLPSVAYPGVQGDACGDDYCPADLEYSGDVDTTLCPYMPCSLAEGECCYSILLGNSSGALDQVSTGNVSEVVEGSPNISVAGFPIWLLIVVLTLLGAILCLGPYCILRTSRHFRAKRLPASDPKAYQEAFPSPKSQVEQDLVNFQGILQVGLYRIVSPTGVFRHYHAREAFVELPEGTVVEIAQILDQSKDGFIMGRIVRPPGYIQLVDVVTGKHCAVMSNSPPTSVPNSPSNMNDSNPNNVSNLSSGSGKEADLSTYAVVAGRISNPTRPEVGAGPGDDPAPPEEPPPTEGDYGTAVSSTAPPKGAGVGLKDLQNASPTSEVSDQAPNEAILELQGEWRSYPKTGQGEPGVIKIDRRGLVFLDGHRVDLDLHHNGSSVFRKDGFLLSNDVGSSSEILWCRPESSPLVWKRIKKHRDYKVGEKVEWADVTDDVPRGTIGQITKLGDRKITVRFPQGIEKELRYYSLISCSVRQQDEKEKQAVDDLRGDWRIHVGASTTVLPGGVVVLEGGRVLYNGTHYPHQDILMVGGQLARGDGWAVDMGASNRQVLIWRKPGEQEIMWRRIKSVHDYKRGERVRWTEASYNVPKGTVGEVVAVTGYTVRVQFNNFNMDIPPGQLLPADETALDSAFGVKGEPFFANDTSDGVFTREGPMSAQDYLTALEFEDKPKERVRRISRSPGSPEDSPEIPSSLRAALPAESPRRQAKDHLAVTSKGEEFYQRQGSKGLDPNSAGNGQGDGDGSQVTRGVDPSNFPVLVFDRAHSKPQVFREGSNGSGPHTLPLEGSGVVVAPKASKHCFNDDDSTANRGVGGIGRWGTELVQSLAAWSPSRRNPQSPANGKVTMLSRDACLCGGSPQGEEPPKVEPRLSVTQARSAARGPAILPGRPARSAAARRQVLI